MAKKRRKYLVGKISVTRSRVMAAIKSRNTSPELALRKLLSQQGLRYRLHRADLLGRPDIVFVRQKVAIFCDGDFWHGRKWKERKAAGFRVRSKYWITKIEGNMARDRRVKRKLQSQGWTVLRFWESDIYRRGPWIVTKVLRTLSTRESRATSQR